MPRPALALAVLLLALPSLRPVAAEPESGGLVIVAPHDWLPALAEFVEHKSAALPVETAALEDVLAGPGVDDPERLKRWLWDAWHSRGARYALLVGDAGFLPVRYMTLDRCTPPAFDYAFYPSDLYYADLARADGGFDDWNGRKEGYHGAYFGEVHGEHHKDPPINFDAIDYRPDLAVGRWPVRNLDELRVVAEKTMEFERALAVAASPAWRARATFVAAAGWVDARRLFDGLIAKLGEAWSADRLYFRDPDAESDLPQPTRDELVPRLRAGCAFVFHAGHGHDHGWEGCLSSADLKALAEAPAPAIYLSAGCSTARFATLPPYEGYVDTAGRWHKGTNHGEVFLEPPPFPDAWQPGPFDRTGLGETLLRAGHQGAVAYIGCNTGSQPCGLTLLRGFAEALAKDRTARLGDLWNAALREYWEAERLADLKPTPDWYPASIFFQGMKFMLFGDPSLVVPRP